MLGRIRRYRETNHSHVERKDFSMHQNPEEIGKKAEMYMAGREVKVGTD